MSKLYVYRLISYFDDWSSGMFYNLLNSNRFCVTIIVVYNFIINID